MRFSEDACYRAICTRDHRFDGQFVRASSKLKVYCRPVCPTPVPKRANCLFFVSAAEAEACGFRPCRRCRPDLSPNTPRWAGTVTTVTRALRLIAEGALNKKDVDDLASRVGMTDRHLRRLFRQHLGCSPFAIAITRRLHLARKLIEKDEHSIIEVAYASGFSSLRRFNDAFRKAYKLSPSRVRAGVRRASVDLPPATYRLRLEYRPPLDWEIVRHCLLMHAIPMVEYVGESIYQRAVAIGDHDSLVTVRYWPNRPYMDVAVCQVEVTDLPFLVASIRHLLDLDADLEPIKDHFRESVWLKTLIGRHPGVRVPGFWDSFEFIVRTILLDHAGDCADALLRRMIEAGGRPLSMKGDSIFVSRAFPTAETLACFGDSLRSVGVPDAAARTIGLLAARVGDGGLNLRRTQSPSELQASLSGIEGIGRRMADYLTRNILERADMFDARDAIAMLGRLNRNARCSSADFAGITEAWRPWRGYAAMLLQKEMLLQKDQALPEMYQASPLAGTVDAFHHLAAS